jgi:putative endonuclease
VPFNMDLARERGRALNPKELGVFGEEFACQKLVQRGYIIRQRNWHCRWGEIDIVALDQEQIVFIEVKTRSNERFGTAEDAFNRSKRKKFVQSAKSYLLDNDLFDMDWRCDMIAIHCRLDGQIIRFDHYHDAIEG